MHALCLLMVESLLWKQRPGHAATSVYWINLIWRKAIFLLKFLKVQNSVNIIK